MEAIVPPSERSSHEELIEIADGYFETIERNDGTIRTRFHPDCNRVENGVQTTNNPDFVVPVARLGVRGAVRARLLPLRRPPARPPLPAGRRTSAGSCSPTASSTTAGSSAITS